MTLDAWRALIGAYVENRIGADAFKRRFLEAFDAAAAARAAVTPKVQALYFIVDAYGGDPTGRGHDVTDDRDLLDAARAALEELGPARIEDAPRPIPAEPALKGEEARAREDAREQYRAAQRRIVLVGGAGCAMMILWLIISVLQFFAVSAQIQSVTDWGPAPATLAGLVTTFIPVVGSVVAFFGAKDVWDWAPWAAGLVFLGVPLAAYAAGALKWRGRR
jgi:hypothetical protein